MCPYLQVFNFDSSIGTILAKYSLLLYRKKCKCTKLDYSSFSSELTAKTACSKNEGIYSHQSSNDESNGYEENTVDNLPSKEQLLHEAIKNNDLANVKELMNEHKYLVNERIDEEKDK